MIRTLGIKSGLGRHAREVDKTKSTAFGVVSSPIPEQFSASSGHYLLTSTIQSVWIQQLTWTMSLALTAFTILLLYVRLFPNKWLHRVIHAIGAFVMAWFVSTVLVLIFQCTPVHYFWTREPPGHCINANVFYVIVGAVSMVTIAVVLCLPLPIIRTLQVSTARKLALGFSFTVGLLCVLP